MMGTQAIKYGYNACWTQMRNALDFLQNIPGFNTDDNNKNKENYYPQMTFHWRLVIDLLKT